MSRLTLSAATIAFVVVSLFASTSTATSAEPTLTTIAAPNAAFTLVTGLNNRGDIAGFSRSGGTGGPSRGFGFMLEDGVFTTLDVPGANLTYVLSINDRGQVCGGYELSGIEHGYIRDLNGITTIDGPSASTTEATSINNRGDVAGYITTGTFHGFVRR